MEPYKSFNKWFVFLVVCFPPAIILLFIKNYSVNIPYMDQWDGFLNILSAFKESSLDFSHLWAQHNEHRLLFPKIIMLLLASISHWNVIWEQYFSFFIQFGVLLLIFGISRRSLSIQNRIIFKISSSILLFSMVQYENWAWGWQIQIFLNIFAFIFSIWALSKWPGSWFGLILAILGAITATYSFSNGILIWIIVLFWILLANTHKKLIFILIWLFAASGIIISYIYQYEKPSHHPSLLNFLENPLEFFAFFLTYIGSPFGRFYNLTGSVLFGILGICILFYLLINLLIYRQNALFKKYLPWLAFILYTLSSAILTGIGRSGFGSTQALYSRYTSFSLLFWVSLFAMILIYIESMPHHKIIFSPKFIYPFAVILFSFFIICHSVSYAQGITSFKNHFIQLSNIDYLLKYERRYGTERYFSAIFPSLQKLSESIESLRQLKMGVFYKEIKNPSGIYIQGSYFNMAGRGGARLFTEYDALILDKNSQVSTEIDIPESADYKFSAELGFSPYNGLISIIIDESEIGKTDCRIINVKKNFYILKWIDYKNIPLSKGVHTITIKSINAPNMVKAITIKNSNSAQ